MTHDAEQWVVLRRDRETGAIGGPDDGAGRDTALFEVTVSCQHGALTYEVPIASFVELLAAMNVLAVRHDHEFSCGCVETDEATARRAVDIWRDEYGTDPVIPYLGSEA